ncbi:MAG: translation initiation factor IF-2 [Ruminococcaceae bacterium]|nr:translation initiation factor IF-2 [Oscillospiraceae bacterium]
MGVAILAKTAKQNKPRIHSIAKDLELVNKDVIDMLIKYDMGTKNHMSTLTAADLDIIFDYYIQSFDDGSDISEFLKKKVEEKPKPAEKPVQEEKASPEEEAPEPEKQEGKKNRYVDTRNSVVDLEKIEQNEKIEEMVAPEITEKATTKQKIKKGQKRAKNGQPNQAAPVAPPKKEKEKEKKAEPKKVMVPDEISVGEFAERLGQSPTEVIKRLMQLGIMASVSQSIDFDTAALIGEDMNAIVEKEVIVTDEDILFGDDADDEASLVPRDPVVVVMGHVDHGKTSLLDAIRSANVIATEAGGITQHIGAYSVRLGDRRITFLDTPGHEAFTAMRARGAQVTDVAIIVVAADDGIMPQTIEALDHAKAAGVSIVIAINKIDRENANPDRVMQELTEHGLVPEDWGGDTICVPISAKLHQNIDSLLEMVLLVADMKELRANPDRLARGTVIEARLDKGRGPVATVLVQNGTLHTGDTIVSGTSMGRVRVMLDDKGNRLKSAGPSTPVEITGMNEVCEGGDLFYAVTDEKMARNVVEARKQKVQDEHRQATSIVSLEDLFSQIQQGNVQDLNIIVKADVRGSVEAVTQSLEKISNEEVRVRVIHGAVGAITESDVMLATASNAIIVGFNVRPDSGARSAAAMHKVDMRMYRVIYQAIEEIEAAMKGMLAPEFKEVTIGHAEIRQTFKVSGVGTIAGCYVQDGKIQRGCMVRIVRDGIVIHEGDLATLRRFKDDVKEVASGYECGMSFEKFNDIKEGDIVECSVMEEVAR